MNSAYLKLDATHSNIQMRMAEIRFTKDQSIRSVKEVLERKFGSSADSMVLELRDASGAYICNMQNDQETLQSYGAIDGMCIHVQDPTPSALQNFDDVSQVEKYEISESDYAKRTDNFRNFKKQMMA